jgi:hypothetical protein
MNYTTTIIIARSSFFQLNNRLKINTLIFSEAPPGYSEITPITSNRHVLNDKDGLQIFESSDRTVLERITLTPAAISLRAKL